MRNVAKGILNHSPLTYAALSLILLSHDTFATEPVRVNPVHSFDIRAALPEKYRQGLVLVQSLVANNTGLYFLIGFNQDWSSRMISDSSLKSILHTDADGRLQKLIGLATAEGASRKAIHDLAVDDLGNCLVLYSQRLAGKFTMEFVAYHSSEIPMKSIPATSPDQAVLPVLAYCVKPGELFYVSGDHYIQKVPLATTGALASSRKRLDGLSVTSPSVLKMSALPGNKLALLQGVDRKLHILDHSSNLLESFLLDEVEEVKLAFSHFRPEAIGPDVTNSRIARTIVLPNLATSQEGEIYVDVAGHDIRSGAVILRLDSSGQVVQSLRCNLSGIAGQDGYLRYAHVGVTGTHLILCSADGHVAVYKR